MRPYGVVVAPPFFERGAGLGEGCEQRLVQELVAQPAVEALMKAFCTGLPGSM